MPYSRRDGDEVQSSHATTESVAPAHQFDVRLSSTRRGARLARRLAVQELAAWGIPYDSEASWAVAVVTAELAANAITHGRVPGRDFRLSLRRHRHHIRVEVTDTRPEFGPPRPLPPEPSIEADSGRGLFLVAVYAEAWGCESRDICTKTVWAGIPCPDA
ncbi:ATP-binding protein [Streptomyces sp. 2131.1]|uniref:ATP-binding protein n=1 Tax=Streptomyces sp. 2131.1 TaxID=1855346 RepID=UPI0035262839